MVMGKSNAVSCKGNPHTSRKKAEPSYALIDSQSVKTAYRSDKKGYDEGKNKRNKASYCN